jgi:type VI secretion system lysozyme-like protein
MPAFKPEDNVRAALFDRLIDLEPEIPREPRPLRAMNVRELYVSVLQELNRLLNSRCPLTFDELENRERTTIDYGVPDFSAFNPQSLDDQKLLAKNIRDTISVYEHRLQGVRVKVEEFIDDKKALLVKVEGVLAFESVREPVSFPLVISEKGEKVAVDANPG